MTPLSVIPEIFYRGSRRF